MIKDPDAKKPDDWVDKAKIVDPDDKKPDDWDDEDDGEWEAPMVDNPDYKGEWKPKQIKNKDYEEGVQLAAYEGAMLGFELWIVNNGTIFDNILVTDDIEYAKAQGEKLWKPTQEGEKEVKEKWDKENKPDEPEG